ncbi:signal peptidase II [Quadrisphaera granulorum]|uniref:Lipoprotein signal peptidase n=1 Tax=Quadrisphaera granulorum TaxID=317664 RepID=A0A316A6V6_9ACTN|nr:signal peptidase II [Quadrisphaera granulorum]PWJ53666.1 signal peptidase II [Quadrisphaera granulorum]SZE96710.1 signal peptidase II [Quadrisphaera granulorum]
MTPTASGATGSSSSVPDAGTDGIARKLLARRLRRFLVVVALLGLAADQITKVLAVALLTPGEPVPVVGDVLQLVLLRNPGAAFSFATGATWIFTIIATVVVAAVLRVSRKLGSRGWALALGLLLAGATGNLVDRLVRAPGFARGHVVDFLALPNWPVFNVADSMICTAAGLIVILALRGVEIDGRRATRSARR